MKQILILSIFSFGFSFGQSSEYDLQSLPKDPVYFIDSIKVDKVEMQNFKSEDISAISVYKDKATLASLGEEAKNGVIYIETKKFSKEKYVNFFKSKSEDYAKIYSKENDDSKFVYILNGNAMINSSEHDLARLQGIKLKSLTVIDKNELQKKYNIFGKDNGVIITTYTE
ncbi:hypothetical protein [Chryseobacterium schmidteae]|uniref:hypothetical protein n=1 Tax=Chryseobacterium schmidteae TaxID=2730404 RepID=UPI001589B4BE|nr:hypothetical protein [Chryseobacterium schmidteae]